MLPHISREKDGKISEELCASAAAMASWTCFTLMHPD